MDLESIMLAKISPVEKGQEPHDFTHRWDMKQKETNKPETSLIQTTEGWLPAGKGG